MDGKNLHFLARYGQALQLAIDDYLSTRGMLGTAVAAESLATAPNKRGNRAPGRKRGGPRRYDAASDRKVLQAWKSRRYKQYADLAAEFNLKPGDVKRAIDRERKR